jgi:hypothetical protein
MVRLLVSQEARRQRVDQVLQLALVARQILALAQPLELLQGQVLV